MQPIFLDYIINWADTAGDAEPVVFAVEIGGAEIYRGRLLCVDGAYSFNLAEIVADSLAQTVPACLSTGKDNYPGVKTSESAPDVKHTVTVTGWYVSNEGGDTPDFTDTPVLLYDWSYDDDSGTPARQPDFLRSDPIDGVIHPLQFIILSVFDNVDLTVTQHRDQTGSDFNGDYGADFGGGGDIVTVHHLLEKTNTVLPPLSWAGRVTAEANALSVEYFVPACMKARYILHYVNAYGGWDSFVPRGLAKMTDGLQRSEYTRRGVNVNSAGGWAPARGRKVFDVAVARRFEMHTDWLTEAQAGRMHHLLESPEVWIYDTVEARFIPAVIDDSDCAYKTHAGEGRKLIAYTLNLSEAINRARR